MLTQQNTPVSHAGEDQASGAFAARSAHWAHVEASVAVAHAASQPGAAPGQCWSTTNEDFDAESLSALVIANDWLRAGDIVYVGEKKPINYNDLVSADDVMLLMCQRSTALAGATADGYPGVTDIQKKILNGALCGWISPCCPPEFFGVANIREHALTDDDLDAAPRAVIGGAA